MAEPPSTATLDGKAAHSNSFSAAAETIGSGHDAARDAAEIVLDRIDHQAARTYNRRDGVGLAQLRSRRQKNAFGRNKAAEVERQRSISLQPILAAVESEVRIISTTSRGSPARPRIGDIRRIGDDRVEFAADRRCPQSPTQEVRASRQSRASRALCRAVVAAPATEVDAKPHAHSGTRESNAKQQAARAGTQIEEAERLVPVGEARAARPRQPFRVSGRGSRVSADSANSRPQNSRRAENAAQRLAATIRSKLSRT